MINQCEWCGRHSSTTVYELVTQQEVCLWCYQRLVYQGTCLFSAMADGELQRLPKAA
ncbi:hypothetical protein [Candidatus Nitronereus thalassa]|uniref:Cytoplasmic protein n=1 Tax=Candidatus Nitronereus thalassa TaxID=3020898 RepID=A0ABU3K5Q4_9BACT|nr:hypothetical protein [Candidatus Nitronereus thalassa]MDT7041725.1 hypothetical protein [Candidatus Nitronereus thalassa]